MSQDDIQYMNDHTFVEGAQEAERQNLQVIYSKPNELFLDMDTEQQFAALDEKAEKLSGWGLIKGGKLIRLSKSGRPHRHIRYELTRSMTPIERIALQLFLGSDPVKEGLAIKRIYDGTSDNPIRLFMVKPFELEDEDGEEVDELAYLNEDDDLPF